MRITEILAQLSDIDHRQAFVHIWAARIQEMKGYQLGDGGMLLRLAKTLCG